MPDMIELCTVVSCNAKYAKCAHIARLHLFYPDKYCDDYQYDTYECSLADSLVYAPDRHVIGTTRRAPSGRRRARTGCASERPSGGPVN